MTLHQLKIFLLVAKRMSISAAAKELRIAQPSVSQHLRLLSLEIGTKLHRKTGRGIELTPGGRLFVKEARLVLSRMEKLKEKLATLPHTNNSKPSGNLVIGGSFSPSVSFLPAAMVAFASRHPHVRMSLRTQDKATTLKMVASGELDIGVTNDPPPSRDLKAEVLSTTRLVAVLPANHPLAKKGRLTFDDLNDLKFVIRRSLRPTSATASYLEFLKKRGIKVEVAMRCDSPQAVKIAVKRNMAVGILYEEVVREELKKGEFKEVRLPGNPVEVRTCILYHKRKALSPTAQAFLNMLRARRPRRKDRPGALDIDQQTARA
ncbi:MAG TPA: LysR family transcriptional regulator [Candidatus Eisenbacteria bacterium]|nr:LysR family transcriptional regulator [Candidatus Eisenbacteria bacterium]